MYTPRRGCPRKDSSPSRNPTPQETPGAGVANGTARAGKSHHRMRGLGQRQGKNGEKLAARASAGGRPASGFRSVHDREDVVFGHDQVLFAADLDLVAGIRGEEDSVALFHLELGAG